MSSTLFLGAQSPGGRILLESLLAEANHESLFYVQAEDRSSHPDPRVKLIRQDWSDQKASQLLMARLNISTVIVVAPQGSIPNSSRSQRSPQRYLDLVIPTETLLSVCTSRNCPFLLLAPILTDPLDPVTLCKRLVQQSPASNALLEFGHLWPGKGLGGSSVARALRAQNISWLDRMKGPLSQALGVLKTFRTSSLADQTSILPMTPNALLNEAVQSAQALISSMNSTSSQNLALHWQLVDRNSPDLHEFCRNLEILSGGSIPQETTQGSLRSLCISRKTLRDPARIEQPAPGRTSIPSPYLEVQTCPRDWSRLIFAELKNAPTSERRVNAEAR